MYLKEYGGLVFINKTKDIIKLFEESTREEIGIALFAYEQFICKGLKVKNKDIERLTEIFEYYDEKLSDDYPSLTNEALQETEQLINDYFFSDSLKRDNHIINIKLDGRFRKDTHFKVNMFDKFGYPEYEFGVAINDNRIKSNYNKDSFNTTYNACKEVYNLMKTSDIKSITDTFKF